MTQARERAQESIKHLRHRAQYWAGIADTLEGLLGTVPSEREFELHTEGLGPPPPLNPASPLASGGPAPKSEPISSHDQLQREVSSLATRITAAFSIPGGLDVNAVRPQWDAWVKATQDLLAYATKQDHQISLPPGWKYESLPQRFDHARALEMLREMESRWARDPELVLDAELAAVVLAEATNTAADQWRSGAAMGILVREVRQQAESEQITKRIGYLEGRAQERKKARRQEASARPHSHAYVTDYERGEPTGVCGVFGCGQPESDKIHQLKETP